MVAVEDIVEVAGRERDIKVDEELADLLLGRHRADRSRTQAIARRRD